MSFWAKKTIFIFLKVGVLGSFLRPTCERPVWFYEWLISFYHNMVFREYRFNWPAARIEQGSAQQRRPRAACAGRATLGATAGPLLPRPPGRVLPAIAGKAAQNWNYLPPNSLKLKRG